MTLHAPISLDDQIRAVARELAMRRNVYPRRVAMGAMKQHDAEYEIAAMETVMETLKAARGANQGTLIT